jgi:phage recombination protein Bet
MSNIQAIQTQSRESLSISEGELINVLAHSLYPGAQLDSIKMVLGYCKAAGLDPMQKPVHIVPIWDNKAGTMRDVVMPGIGLYRSQASRSGEYAGVSEPEFGDDVSENLGGTNVTYPKWCKVIVKRLLPNGVIVEFAAKELWKENYAIKGGKEKSIAPNAMWTKRPYAQLAKCAEAQALRKAFPEFGSQPTADEMEGKEYDITNQVNANKNQIEFTPEQEAERGALIETLNKVAVTQGLNSYAEVWMNLTAHERKLVGAVKHEELKKLAQKADAEVIQQEPATVDADFVADMEGAE